MSLTDKIRNSVIKLQNLPEPLKLGIMWGVVGLIALVLFFFWFNSAKNNLSKISVSESLGLPDMQSISPIAILETGEPSIDTTPVVVDMSNWQTYSNERYQFTIKYPTDWFINSTDPNNIYISRVSPKDGEMPFKSSALVMSISTNNSPTLLQAVEKKLTYDGILPSFAQQSTTIGGKNAMQVATICEGVGCGAPMWFMIKDGYLYYFSSGLGYEAMFDQILSTFQFAE